MNSNVTGKIIKEIRENKKITHLRIANTLNVSNNIISKWVFHDNN